MINLKFSIFLRFLLIFTGIIIFSGCNSYKGESPDISEVSLNENKKIINLFESDAKYVFVDLIDKEIYSTYNADRLIFQVKVDNLSTSKYLDLINSRMAERGWYFKNNYKASYIYCDSNLNQLEIISPLDLTYSYEFGEGQTIKQLPNVWNVSFTHSIHKRYVCNSSE